MPESTYQQLSSAFPEAQWAWQDLQGFHADSQLPTAPPRTSILWGWDTSRAIRVRLDGEAVHVFECDAECVKWVRIDELQEGDNAMHHRLVTKHRTTSASGDWECGVVRNDLGIPATMIRRANPSA